MNIYKFYCRCRSWCPVLISQSRKLKLKAYQNNLRRGDGDMLSLKVCRRNLPSRIFRNGTKWMDMHVCADFGPYPDERRMYSLKDNEFEKLHVRYQSEKLKALVREGIEKYHGDKWKPVTPLPYLTGRATKTAPLQQAFYTGPTEWPGFSVPGEAGRDPRASRRREPRCALYGQGRYCRNILYIRRRRGL